MSRTITVKDFSKKYEHCDRSTYENICKLFLWKLSLAIIRETYICQLPYALGTIYIGMKETSKKCLDYGLFKKTGIKQPYRNFHTFNKSFSFKWSKKNAIFKNKNIYYFKPIRDEIKREIGSRGLAQWIKDCARNNKDYKTVGSV